MDQTQNPVSRLARRVFLLAAALVGFQAAGGCGKVDSDDTGSETHWLVRCDSDAECGRAGSCECGICSRSCVLGGDCTVLGVAGVQCVARPAGCAAPQASYGDAPASALCLLPCSENEDCAALGGAAECTQGHCELTSDGITSGAGGSSAAGGSGGNNNTGGTGAAADVPTLCDGSEDVRFVSLIGGGFVSPLFSFAQTYGSEFYAIDGQCRYWHGFNDGRVYDGTLDAASAQSFARALGFGSLSRYAGYVGNTCPDAGGITLWSPEGKIACVCDCSNDMNAPSGWRAAFVADNDARRTLLAGEQPVENVAARLVLLSGSALDGIFENVPEAWPLTRPPAPNEIIATDDGSYTVTESSGALISDASELLQLRAARSAFRAREGSSPATLLLWNDPATQTRNFYGMLLRDEVPPAVRLALERAQSAP